MKPILNFVLLVSVIQASFSSDYDYAWTQTIIGVHQGAQDADKAVTKAYNTTKRDARRLGRSVSEEISKLSYHAKLDFDDAKQDIETDAIKDEDRAKVDYDKAMSSLKKALNQTEDNLNHFSVEIRTKLEKLKVTTEHKLTKIAADAGNKLEMGISKGLVDYQSKEESILQKVITLVKHVFYEANPNQNCQEEDYIQCVIHRNLTFREGLRSSCATKYRCQISFLKNSKMQSKLDQAEIGIQSLENQSPQNTENELQIMQKRDKSQKLQEIDAKNQIESQFLNKARKIMIDGGCQDTCIDQCTSSMKQYLTNTCNKCKCGKQNNILNMEAVQIIPNQVGLGTNYISLVVLGISVVAGTYIYQNIGQNANLQDEYIKI